MTVRKVYTTDSIVSLSEYIPPYSYCITGNSKPADT